MGGYVLIRIDRRSYYIVLGIRFWNGEVCCIVQQVLIKNVDIEDIYIGKDWKNKIVLYF